MALRKLFISKPTEMWVFFRLLKNDGRPSGDLHLDIFSYLQ